MKDGSRLNLLEAAGRGTLLHVIAWARGLIGSQVADVLLKTPVGPLTLTVRHPLVLIVGPAGSGRSTMVLTLIRSTLSEDPNRVVCAVLPDVFCPPPDCNPSAAPLTFLAPFEAGTERLKIVEHVGELDIPAVEQRASRLFAVDDGNTRLYPEQIEELAVLGAPTIIVLPPLSEIDSELRANLLERAAGLMLMGEKSWSSLDCFNQFVPEAPESLLKRLSGKLRDRRSATSDSTHQQYMLISRQSPHLRIGGRTFGLRAKTQSEPIAAEAGH